MCGIAPDVGMFDKNDADANLCLLLFENNDIDDDVLDMDGSFVEKIFLLVNMLLIHNNELQWGTFAARKHAFRLCDCIKSIGSYSLHMEIVYIGIF